MQYPNGLRCSVGASMNVRTLLKQGASVTSLTRDGHNLTALHFAASSGDVPTVAAILEAQPVVDAADSEGRTPLFIAASRAYVGATSYLILNGASAKVLEHFCVVCWCF